MLSVVKSSGRNRKDLSPAARNLLKDLARQRGLLLLLMVEGDWEVRVWEIPYLVIEEKKMGRQRKLEGRKWKSKGKGTRD